MKLIDNTRKIERLKQLKKDLESKEVIKNYLKWEAIKIEVVDKWGDKILVESGEQRAIRDYWEAYYKDSRESIQAKRFFAQGKAMKEGNIALIKAYAQKAKEERESRYDYDRDRPQTIHEPAVYDYCQEVTSYNMVMSKLRELQSPIENTYDQAKDVFGA